MITLMKSGRYTLIETRRRTKILYLDGRPYAWVETETVGDILVTSRRVHKADEILATGKYRLYRVKNEPRLSDHQHLELEAGPGYWQGYLLLTGLPTLKHKRTRIIPIPGIITLSSVDSHRYRSKKPASVT